MGVAPPPPLQPESKVTAKRVAVFFSSTLKFIYVTETAVQYIVIGFFNMATKVSVKRVLMSFRTHVMTSIGTIIKPRTMNCV